MRQAEYLNRKYIYAIALIAIILISVSPINFAWGQNIPLILLGIEVTQAVQDMDNSVPLFEGRRTVARVYLFFNWNEITAAAVPNGFIPNVSGILSVFRDGNLIARIPSSNLINVGNAYDISVNRADVNKSINFILPAGLTMRGSTPLHLEFTPIINRATGGISSTASISCLNCDNKLSWQTIQDLAVRFAGQGTGNQLSEQIIQRLGTAPSTGNIVPPFRAPLPIVELSLKHVSWRCTNVPSLPWCMGQVFSTAPGDVNERALISWLKRAFPISDVRITNSVIFNMNTRPECGGLIANNNALTWGIRGFLDVIFGPLNPVAVISSFTRPTPVLYIVADNPPSPYYRGCAIPGIAHTAPVGSTEARPPQIPIPPQPPITLPDLSEPGPSMTGVQGAHELGHMYGIYHPGFEGDPCIRSTQSSPSYLDNRYPYPNGQLSSIQGWRYFGFDVGDASLGIVPRAIPAWGHELMTYCGDLWISDYTYLNILRALRTGSYYDFPLGLSPFFGNSNESSSINTSGDDNEPSTYQDTMDPPVSESALQSNETLFLTGTINLSNSTVIFGSSIISPGLEYLKQIPQNSSFSISMIDVNNKTLASYPMAPSPYYKEDEKENHAIFYEAVPFIEGTKYVVISKNYKEVGSLKVSDNAPEVQIISPKSGDTLDSKQITMDWNASDKDSDNLKYSVIYTNDAESTWHTIAEGLNESSFTIDTSYLPGGNKSMFGVVASDGLRAGVNITTGFITVPNKNPIVNIAWPSNGSPFFTTNSSTTTIGLYGDAWDLEDGTLNGTSLAWMDSQDRLLGHGQSIDLTGLNPGKHTINLLATDSHGQMDVDSIEVEINELQNQTMMTSNNLTKDTGEVTP